MGGLNFVTKIALAIPNSICYLIGVGNDADRKKERPDKMNSSLLFSSLSDVVEIEGRWFITAGHCGFNSNANNGRGYATAEMARKSSERFRVWGEMKRKAAAQ